MTGTPPGIRPGADFAKRLFGAGDEPLSAISAPEMIPGVGPGEPLVPFSKILPDVLETYREWSRRNSQV